MIQVPFTIIIVLVVVNLITLLSIYPLGNLHLSQTVGGIRPIQWKEIHPIPKLKGHVLEI
jgi:hypothetical protein